MIAPCGLGTTENGGLARQCEARGQQWRGRGRHLGGGASQWIGLPPVPAGPRALHDRGRLLTLSSELIGSRAAEFDPFLVAPSWDVGVQFVPLLVINSYNFRRHISKVMW